MRRRLAPALALVLATATAGPAWAGLADRVGATFALMADDFVKAFEPVEGLVVALDGEDLFLDLSAATGAQAGQELTVFRKGEPFHHPYTGRALGRYEQVLGHAQIRRVHPQFSVATFVGVPDAPRPRPEDGVRITRGRIRVAITPALDLAQTDADLRRLPFLMSTVLERSKRFQVVDPLVVGDMFASGGVRVEEMLARPQRALRAVRNLEVAGWLVPVLIERRGVTYLDVTYISAITGTALISRRQALVPASAVEEQRFPWEPRVAD